MMGETSWEGLSAEECVMRMVNGIKTIIQVHDSGTYCYDTTEDWRKVRYAWHNPLLPPEYRRSCLNGKVCGMNPNYDLYYFAACSYEKMTGCRAPYNFQINLSWKENLKKRMEGWDVEYQEIMLRLIETFTQTRRSGSGTAADELLEICNNPMDLR